MNYRHVYHAGNFADVHKHILLVRVIEYLKRKDKPFRVIDTHAGTGDYDLSSAEAQKTGEWRDGIARLLEAPLAEPAAALVAPYLDIVRGFNQGHPFRYYPGSPAITRSLLRARDRLTAIEKHPQDAFSLRTRFAGDFQARVIELDGWLALGAHVPPKERRGLVLVDPPFEEAGEFARLAEGVARAWRRWPGGIYLVWYPIKDRAAVHRFRSDLQASGVTGVLDVTFEIRRAAQEPRLDGSGMVVVNPPYTLKAEMEAIMPALASLLGTADCPGGRTEWLVPEAG